MHERSQIKLKKSAIHQIPFDSYEKNFRFIVNGKEFPTNRFIADMLSPKISQLHDIDATIDNYTIKTEETGDFAIFLNLINFELNEIPENELPFIASITEILDIKSIEFHIKNKDENLTISNVFKLIKIHEKNPIFYSKVFQKEIDFASSHFHEIKEEQEEQLIRLNNSTIEKIFKNDHFQLNSEDQLLRIINKLYSLNSTNSYFYSYVEFVNISADRIIEFIQLFDTNDLTTEIWHSISKRLQQEIVKPKENSNTTKGRYKLDSKQTENEKIQNKKGTKIDFNGSNKLDGIINSLRKQSNGNIQNIIDITASQIGSTSYPLLNIFIYEDPKKFTYTNNSPNSWICVEFKNKKIIPSHYTIQSLQNNDNHLKSWIVEGSNDKNSWDKLDEQQNNSVMNGRGNIHTFAINNQNEKEYKFIRIFQTGKNWKENDYLDLSALEFHGTLI